MSSLIHNDNAGSDLPTQNMTIELQEEAAHIEEHVVELRKVNSKLKVENHELKEKIEIQKNVTFIKKVHFCHGDEVPFCPDCKQKRSLLIRLAGPRQTETGLIYSCPVCKKVY